MSVQFSTSPSPGSPSLGSVVYPGQFWGNATVVQLASGGYQVTGYAGYVNVPDAPSAPPAIAPPVNSGIVSSATTTTVQPVASTVRSPSVAQAGGLAPMGNIYAPEWFGFSSVLANIRDTEFSYDLPAIAVAGQAYSLGNQMQIGGDADFLAREFEFVVIASTAGTGTPAPSDIRVRLRSGDGRMLTTDFVPIVDLNGPIAVPWPLRKGSIVLVDYFNANANNTTSETVWMILRGWKRKPCSDPTEAHAPYVPMYQRYAQLPGSDMEDFEYPFTFTSAGAQDLLQQPLQTDNDADFLWSCTVGDFNTANNDVATVGNVGLTFYDTDEVPLSVRSQINPWGSPNVGMFRENILSSGGGRPMPFFPSILIPRGGVVLVDISFAAAATVRFSLRGQKIYGSCIR